MLASDNAALKGGAPQAAAAARLTPHALVDFMNWA
jgi:hypothetical protein